MPEVHSEFWQQDSPWSPGGSQAPRSLPHEEREQTSPTSQPSLTVHCSPIPCECGSTQRESLQTRPVSQGLSELHVMPASRGPSQQMCGFVLPEVCTSRHCSEAQRAFSEHDAPFLRHKILVHCLALQRVPEAQSELTTQGTPVVHEVGWRGFGGTAASFVPEEHATSATSRRSTAGRR